jgi:hypothetical protein
MLTICQVVPESKTASPAAPEAPSNKYTPELLVSRLLTVIEVVV